MFKRMKNHIFYTYGYAIAKFTVFEKDFTDVNVNIKCHKNFIIKYHREQILLAIEYILSN